MLSYAGWGLFVCVVAMLAAALVEVWRLQMYKEGKVIHEETFAQGQALGHGTSVVDISVFWQTPQYLLVGLSEVHTALAKGALGL